MMEATWYIDLLRQIFMALDTVIYSLIYLGYKLVICLANIKIFEESDFASFAQRIYVFLGIFMLFRIGFSLLQYIVDPDKATDKSSGAGKMITNCAIALVMLVITPWLFSQLYSFQSALLSENVLGKLILGDAIDSNNNDNELTVNNAATDTQFLLFGAFFQVDTNVIGAPCKNVDSPILGSVAMASDRECLGAVDEELKSNGSSIGKFYKNKDNSDQRDISNFNSIVKSQKDGKYIFDYKYGISTIAGVVVVFMLITFCIDIAIRAIYLGFLQLISPIPIISYMDPKQNFGNGIFSNWLKEVGKTFISLFIRLGAIFLAIYFIQIISRRILVTTGEGLQYYDSNFCQNCGEMNPWIYVLLIIGAFLFAKKVPQYIETIFGFKSSGDMLKSPFAKIRDSGLASGVVGGIGGGLIGAGLGTVASYNEGRSQGETKPRLAASVMGGFTSGFARGAYTGGKNFQKGGWFKPTVRTAGDVSFAKEIRREGGNAAVFRNTLMGVTNSPYKVDRYDKEIGIRNQFIENAKKSKAMAEDKVTTTSDSYKSLMEKIQYSRQHGTEFTHEIYDKENKKWVTRTYQGDAQGIFNAEKDARNTMKEQAKEFAATGVIEARSGFGAQDLHEDKEYKQIESYKTGNERIIVENPGIDGVRAFSDYKDMLDVSDEMDNVNVKLQQSDEYENARNEKEIRQKYARNDWTNEHR